VHPSIRITEVHLVCQFDVHCSGCSIETKIGVNGIRSEQTLSILVFDQSRAVDDEISNSKWDEQERILTGQSVKADSKMNIE